MRHDKDIALRLRKRGKSYNQINKLLRIPKSTLSCWFGDNPESQKIKAMLSEKSNQMVAKRIEKFVKNNKERWEKWREEARAQARKDFPKLIKNRLFIAGIMLYWGEGDSNPKNPIRLTNTNPEMIALYVKFLMNALKIPIDKINGAIVLYPDLSEKKSLDFWSKNSKLPQSHFFKTQFIKGKHPTKRLPNGICMIICNSRQLKEKILVWIDLLSKAL